MAELNENPCSKGLTPECFKTFPDWAKRAFFLRLLYLLLPVEITSKLPVIFRLTFLPPGTIFPPGWIFGDPWPEGFFLWEPFDPPASLDLLEGILVAPGTEFPSDWKPGDPLPEGSFDLTTLSEMSEDGLLGLFNLNMQSWGKWSIPRKGPSYDYFLYEHWDGTSGNDPSIIPPLSDGTLKIIGTTLVYNTSATVTASAQIIKDEREINEDFDILFDIWYASGSRYTWFDFYTGTYLITMYWDFPDGVRIRDESGLQIYSCANFESEKDYWKIEVRGDQIKLYQSSGPNKTDWIKRGDTLTLLANTTNQGRFTWRFWDTATIYLDLITFDDGSGVVTIT